MRVCFICTGNICRSPMAAVVMTAGIARRGLTGLIVADSGGTGGWHVGAKADQRARSVLAENGYDGSVHRGRQFALDWFTNHDLFIALDGGHQRLLRALAPDDDALSRIHLLRRFGARPKPGDLDVPDPYADDRRAFVEVLDQIEDACEGLLDWISAGLASNSSRDQSSSHYGQLRQR